MALKKIPSYGKDIDKLECSYTAGEMVNWTSTSKKKKIAVSCKVKNTFSRIPISREIKIIFTENLFANVSSGFCS